MKKFFLLILLFISANAMSQNEQLKTDWASLKRYSAENAKLKPLSNNEIRVVFMGNSITEFWLRYDSSFFKDNLFIDRGVSGQTTPQMLVRFRQDVILLKPSVVVILAGINDIAENTGPIALEDVFGNIVSMAELAKVNNIRVVLSSVLPACDFPWTRGLQPAEKVIKLNAMIQDYCKANNIVYADYFSSMVDERNGLDKNYSKDGVHPTIAGYKMMEPLVQKAIETALSQE